MFFLSDHDQLGETGLWEVPIEGPDTAARRISPDPVPGGFVLDVTALSPDGAGALYVGRLTNSDPEIWISDSMVFRADFETGDLSEWSATTP